MIFSKTRILKIEKYCYLDKNINNGDGSPIYVISNTHELC